MSDFSGELVADATLDDAYTKPRGWRHGATWTYLIMLAASAVALVVSFVLSAETLKLARNPGQKLSCDVNAVMSCSTVAESWQAEIVRFAGLSFPNAFFGIAAESVFVTIAVIGLTKVAVPRWFALCTWLGGLAALAYSYWLTSQSLFVIQRAMPVVPMPDVLHHRAVHGVVSCHGGGSGDSGQRCGRAHLLPS